MTFCGTITDYVSAATMADSSTLPPSDASEGVSQEQKHNIQHTQRHPTLFLVTETKKICEEESTK